MVAVFDCRGAHRSHVGAGIGLGDGKAAQPLGADDLGEELLLLLLIAEIQ